MARLLCTIELLWDGKGNIRHQLSSAFPLSQYQIQDAMAASVPCLVSHQFSSLRPVHAIPLCRSLVNLLESGQARVAPIDTSIKDARIKWHSQPPLTYVTFHPRIRTFSNGDRVEEGIRQLLYNYTAYVLDWVSSPERDFKITTTKFTLVVMLTYLQETLLPISRQLSQDPTKIDISIIRSGMIPFTKELYSHWESQELAPSVQELVDMVKAAYHELTKL